MTVVEFETWVLYWRRRTSIFTPYRYNLNNWDKLPSKLRREIIGVANDDIQR